MRKLTFRELEAAEMLFSKPWLRCAGGTDAMLSFVPGEDLVVENAHHLSWSEGSPSARTRWRYPFRQREVKEEILCEEKKIAAGEVYFKLSFVFATEPRSCLSWLLAVGCSKISEFIWVWWPLPYWYCWFWPVSSRTRGHCVLSSVFIDHNPF